MAAPAARLALVLLAVAASSAWAGNRRPSDTERGQELYERHCQACHGTHARGDGPATDALVAPVPSAVGTVTRDAVDDLVDVVLRGRGAMPGYEASFDRYDARRVLRVMADLAARPATERASREAPPPTAGSVERNVRVGPPKALEQRPPGRVVPPADTDPATDPPPEAE